MPQFDTPKSITVTVEVGVGSVRIAASDRTDTVVEVRPTNEADQSDVEAARQLRVDYANGVLRIAGPKRRFDFSRKTRSVQLSVDLPSGSAVSADLQLGDLRCTGRLGDCRINTSLGNLSVERTGAARLSTAMGDVIAEAIGGDAEVSTGSGRVEIGEIAGTAVVKNSNGETTIDAVSGDVRVRAANGGIRVGRAGAGVDAKTSLGSVRLGEVVRGSVVLGSAAGDVEVGIAQGTAAWLEVNTGFGQVHNLLENVTRPDEADETVEVRGSTSFGDIVIRRSSSV